MRKNIDFWSDTNSKYVEINRNARIGSVWEETDTMYIDLYLDLDSKYVAISSNVRIEKVYDRSIGWQVNKLFKEISKYCV